MTKGKILWADDEIDHLKSHILFLEERGYSVTPVTNAEDAISLVREELFDLVLLDEMMPGMDGLQAISVLKNVSPSLPVIMITKSEEENLMEEAIGSKIEDYLTKPVNPSQILSSCKRILERKRISEEKITRDYTSEFQEISSLLNGPMQPEGWIDIHLKLSEREIELDLHSDLGLRQTLSDQRRECNQLFGRYIETHYKGWVNGEKRPVLSIDIIEKHVVPCLKRGEQVLFILIDNLRLDQWLVIEPLLYGIFQVQRDYYFSILPSATPYSRNAIFAGYFPRDIERKYPDLWRQGEDDESSRNRFEAQFLKEQLQRCGVELRSDPKYVKFLDPEDAKQISRNVASYINVPLVSMVFNFVDILAHRRSDSQIIREIVPDEPAYRSLTRTWFEHSSLYQILKYASAEGLKVILTTDHGSIRTMRGSTVYADRKTSTNIRYKYGRGIRGVSKHLLEIKDPIEFGLPARGINTNYLIAKEDYYFVYPTNYHEYLALYKDSFQHGGISMEEMILPVVSLSMQSGR
jgi:CheY-like chemotaxis protein